MTKRRFFVTMLAVLVLFSLSIPVQAFAAEPPCESGGSYPQKIGDAPPKTEATVAVKKITIEVKRNGDNISVSSGEPDKYSVSSYRKIGGNTVFNVQIKIAKDKYYFKDISKSDITLTGETANLSKKSVETSDDNKTVTLKLEFSNSSNSSASVSCGPAYSSSSCGWRQFSNGNWYYVDSNGNMYSGWLEWNGGWYYLDKSGTMLTGWQLIDGYWYYFNTNGLMCSNCYITSEDGCCRYYLESSGKMRTGYTDEYNGNRFFVSPEGYAIYY